MEARLFKKAIKALSKLGLLTSSIAALSQSAPPTNPEVFQAEIKQAVEVLVSHFVVDPTNSVPTTGKPLPLNGTWSRTFETDSCPNTKYSCFHLLYQVPGAPVSCEWIFLLRETVPQGVILYMNEDAARYFTYKTTNDSSKNPMIEKISTKPPIFPPLAKAQRTGGIVKMLAQIDASGHVQDVEVISGPDLLRSSATDAVKQWVYKPLVIDSVAVPIRLLVNITYNFQSSY